MSIFVEWPWSLKKYQSRLLRTSAEVRALWELDFELYGPDGALDYERYCSWWAAYSDGLFGLFDGDTIIGGIGFWPIRKPVFVEILEGRDAESELVSSSFFPLHFAPSCTTWYLSGIVLKAKYRPQPLLRKFLHDFVMQWAARREDLSKVDICALGYSKEGLRLLQRFDFVCVKHAQETKGGLPVYALLDVDFRTIGRGRGIGLDF